MHKQESNIIGLVIVHPEQTYNDSPESNAVFERISARIQTSRPSEKHYILGDESPTLEESNCDPTIKKLSLVRRNTHYIPRIIGNDEISYESQFIVAKQSVEIDRCSHVHIAGFSRGHCVRGIFNLFNGGIPDRNFKFRDYLSHAKEELNMSHTETQNVMTSIIPATIDEDFCL